MPWDGQLNTWFQTGIQQRPVYGFNTHESHLFNRRQYGGTFILVFGPASEYIAETGVDSSGLGRWSWVRFSSRSGLSTTIYTAYRPVRQSRHHAQSTYMQHSRYLESTGDRTCPRRAFLRDLETEISTRLHNGERVIIAGDFNEHTATGHLHRLFTNLGFREATFDRHNSPPPPTMNRGTIPVDAVWLSPGLPTRASTWLSFSFSPGDHRAAVIDFHLDELLGEPAKKVFSPHGRRLNTKIPGVTQCYIRFFEKHCANHHILSKLYKLSTDWRDRWHVFSAEMETLDRLKTEGMIFAEKRCRRLHTGATFFSPEIDFWYKRRILYSMLLKQKNGLRKTRRATILKLAKKCEVNQVFTIPLPELKLLHADADRQYRALKPRSAELREQFLRNRLNLATDGSPLQKFLSEMIIHERQRSVSRFLRRMDGVPLRKSVYEVEEEDEHGTIHRATTQKTVEQALTRCLESRFRLTESSPIMQPALFSLLGNGGLTQTGAEILAGHVPRLPILPTHTRWLLEGMKLPTPNLPKINVHITKEDFQRYWRRAKKKTSSSISGLHFGHYKASTSSNTLSEIHSFFTEILFRTGYPLQRWKNGLQVILEKKQNVILVSKLRAILLMEADFNFGNKLLVGSRMIKNVHKNGHIPLALYGGVKGRRVEIMALGRRLIADVLRQKRSQGAIASVDAQACYDRITHSTASLCCQ